MSELILEYAESQCKKTGEESVACINFLLWDSKVQQQAWEEDRDGIWMFYGLGGKDGEDMLSWR